MDKKHASSKRYPPELKERAVKMVLDLQHQDPGDHQLVADVDLQGIEGRPLLDVGAEVGSAGLGIGQHLRLKGTKMSIASKRPRRLA